MSAVPAPSERGAALRGLRRPCHFRPGPNGVRAWDVHRQIRLSPGLPVQAVQGVPLGDIAELDKNGWCEHADELPTPRAIVEHVRLMDAADLRWPVILSGDGRVMDGMHRIAQALRLGHTHVAAVRFAQDSPPDPVGMDPATPACD